MATTAPAVPVAPGWWGAGLRVIDSGTIAGGLSSGGTQANAITFTGGANTLTLQQGWSLTGDIGVTGSLTFDQAIAVTLSNAITGTGSVIQAGPGTLALTGVNTYAGGTTIDAGTLQIGDGGTNGSITGAVVDNAALTFNRSDAMTYGGVITGSGSVTQAGPAASSPPPASPAAALMALRSPPAMTPICPAAKNSARPPARRPACGPGCSANAGTSRGDGKLRRCRANSGELILGGDLGGIAFAGGSLRLGAGAGALHDSLAVDARGASGHLDQLFGALYGGASFGAVELSAGAPYAR